MSQFSSRKCSCWDLRGTTVTVPKCVYRRSYVGLGRLLYYNRSPLRSFKFPDPITQSDIFDLDTERCSAKYSRCHLREIVGIAKVC